MGVTLSLHPEPVGEIPPQTARVARSAFPKGSAVIRLRDEFGELYRDEDFRSLYPRRGQPASIPGGASLGLRGGGWHLSLYFSFSSI